MDCLSQDIDSMNGEAEEMSWAEDSYFVLGYGCGFAIVVIESGAVSCIRGESCV